MERETGRERGTQGVARSCVRGCACVWVQGRGRDRVRYVMRYQIRLCIVVMFRV